MTAAGKNFWHFESGQVRPLALSPDGTRLFAVNTPDNHLEIFAVTAQGLEFVESVPVGLEPVAVAARSDDEVWVVNHVSDSISIVDISASPARVTRTLLVGDEPRDIVFAGTPAQAGDPFPRAFITTAHRGQVHGIDGQGEKYGDFFTPSTGRADVWVFDANNLGSAVGGTPETILTLFGDTPRALAVTPSGDTVYAAIFHSGNKTTISPENGTVTLPNSGVAPSVPTIVQFDGSDWVDDGGSVDTSILLQLPDLDVFEIDADAATPVETRNFAGVGTILFNMTIDPTTGNLYVSNTEANNLVPTEPGLEANIHRSRITMIDPAGTVAPRHLNKHINYATPAGSGSDSLATPMEMVVAPDGKLYVAAFSSSRIGIFQTSELDNDSFTPDAQNHIAVSGGGPSGIVLDAAHDRLYVLTRFDNGISVIDRTTATETGHLLLHNPEPDSVREGRPFLYDAALSSTNGEASCSSCHVFGRMDDLAWDLGDPNGSIIENPNPFVVNTFGTPQFHPMKGPMVTQSLRGMDNHGPMHWRGDRSGELNNDTFDNETEAFRQFNPAFVGLLGRNGQLSSAQMNLFADFALQLVYPPNPIRNLDNSLTSDEAAGENIYMTQNTDGNTCNTCHVLSPENGFFGSGGLSSFEAAPQDMKVAHLRNMYQKVGMFGGVPTTISAQGAPQSVSTPTHGDPDQPQVRGFGYSHSGVVDSLESFSGISLFNYQGNRDQAINRISRFMLAFPAELAPVVGQQVTLDAGNVAMAGPRIDLLIQRAQAAYPSPVSAQQMECDLVVQGIVNGQPRNWLLNTGSGLFEPDHSNEAPLGDAALRGLAAAGTELTYTCAPPGSGQRMALDRDQDGLLNFDEIDDHGSSPVNGDTDEDGLSDIDEVNVHGTNPAAADSDVDGLTDPDELSVHGTDPNNPDSDGDGLLDGDEVTGGTNPGDAAPAVSVLAPTSGSKFAPGEVITLQGLAQDAEDGDISASLQWSSDLEGGLGAGSGINVTLSEGIHTITASVIDSAGALSTQAITLDVESFTLGDINGDTTVDVIDLLWLQQSITGQRNLIPAESARGDLYPAGSGDGQLDISDVFLLQQLISLQ